MKNICVLVTLGFLTCLVPTYGAPAPLSTPSCVLSKNCEMQQFTGCYVVNGLCRCAQGLCCENPFNYSSLENCLAENPVEMEDPCKEAPCKHQGYCVQLRRPAAYRCECQTTGYFGPRCHEKCPKNPFKAIYNLLKSKAEFARRRVYNMLACLN